jgi:hypothetical protein
VFVEFEMNRVMPALAVLAVLHFPSVQAQPLKAAGEPKAAIGLQLELLRKGDADAMKTHVTERLKDRVTKEAVADAKKNLEKVTLDELVDAVEITGSPGERKAVIKMKSGRKLTTLFEKNGVWLADTIWFK